MKRKYSLGVFFDIYTNKQTDWGKSLNFIQSLDGLEHLELLFEYIPTTKQEINFFTNLGKKYQLIIHSTFLDLTMLSPHNQINQISLAKFKQCYQLGLQLNAKAFTIHAGLMPAFWSKQQTNKQLKSQLNQLASSDQLPVCVENMSAKSSIQIPYPCTPQHLDDISKFTNLTIDIGHFLKTGVNPIPIITKHQKKIINIHLHDSRINQDHIALGKGNLDLSAFLNTLNKINYQNFVTLEIMGKKHIKQSWNTINQALIQK